MKIRILCLHQSAELYGSDRSFLTVIEGVCKNNIAADVVVPFDGPLVEKLRAAGAEVTFFSSGILRKQLLKRPFIYSLDVLRAIMFYVRKFRKYDAIYINTSVMLAAIIASAFYRFSGKKIYCHVREIPSGVQMFFFRWLFILSGVNLVFNSEATRRSFQLKGVVVYNGVSPLETYHVKKESTDEVNILLIGRINTWKGQGFLIEAIKKMERHKRKCINVRIVGSAFEGYEYLEQDLRERIKEFGVGENVTLVGFCDDPSPHYSWADYVVVPSIKPEPFGRVAIEAFSSGKPVIAAEHGGLVEIVSNGFDGFLFTPSSLDGLISILESLPMPNSEGYRHMSSNAEQTYRLKFSEKSYQNEMTRLLI